MTAHCSDDEVFDAALGRSFASVAADLDRLIVVVDHDGRGEAVNTGDSGRRRQWMRRRQAEAMNAGDGEWQAGGRVGQRRRTGDAGDGRGIGVGADGCGGDGRPRSPDPGLIDDGDEDSRFWKNGRPDG
ncbi:hypothetical protein ACLOJK_027054, partial [Asimina triloba]